VSLVRHPWKFVGPGMRGPDVEEVQRLVGAEVTGEYDTQTVERVRGLQVLHKCVLTDGIFDEEIETKLNRVVSRRSE
jgi:hypothetical protein